MSSIGDYNTIMSDHNIFNQIVYTPLSDALRLLEERKKDPELTQKIKDLLKNRIPEILIKNNCAISARQLATPNWENRRFISISKENGLKPVFFEYYEDKLTSNNKYKHSLGHIHIGNSVNKKGEDIVEKISIVDFNVYNGKKIKEVHTRWGDKLVDFHRNLFDLYGIGDIYFFNENDWYEKPKNETPKDFYYNFFVLMTCYGILFENFIVSDDSEGLFTKEVILPTLDKVINDTGVKPLIVPVDSLETEVSDFWYYHEDIIKKIISNK